MILKPCSTFLLLLFALPGIAQDKREVKIGRAYAKGHYQRVIEKSEVLSRQSAYRKSAWLHLYQTLAYTALADQSKFPDNHHLNKAMDHYVSFTDAGGVTLTEVLQQDVDAYHTALRSKAENLVQKGYEKQAALFTTHLATYFEDTLTAYTPPVRIEPVSNITEFSTDTTPPAIEFAIRDSLIFSAQSLLGTPYKYGGQTTAGFDCSGFTGYTYKARGYDLPRSSSSQAAMGKHLPIDSVQKGDLLFFGESKKGRISHVALVISNKGEPVKIIHSTSSRGVMIDTVSDSAYWEKRVLFGLDAVSILNAEPIAPK